MTILENLKMQTPDSTISSPLATYEVKVQNLKSSSSSVSRLWRPAAQRNLRNQWMKLVAHKRKWTSTSSNGKSHAMSLVNAHLSQRYMPWMDLGVLGDMPNIRQKACLKLARQQKLYRENLLSSYKDLVDVVSHIFNDSKSMRSFMKGEAGSPFVRFSSYSEDKNDLGDGGGIPVFTFWPIPYYEKLAEELVQMYASELVLKRLLVLELLSLSCEEQQTVKLSWSNELYPGEFEHLSSIDLYCEETCQPVPPTIIDQESDSPVIAKSNIQLDPEVLQVYITTWFVEVNIDTHRIEDIFSTVGEEMHISLS